MQAGILLTVKEDAITYTETFMKYIINSIAAGNEWPVVMWIRLGRTSGNSLDLRGLKGHVRAISRDETVQPFRTLSLS